MSNPFKVNRVLSAKITPVLLKFPITPNHVTCSMLFLGILSSVLFARGTYESALIAALLYQLACVLDNCDGEIARAKNLGSKFGAYFDIVADFVTDAALFWGLAAGLSKQGLNPNIHTFFWLCMTGGFLHLGMVLLEKWKGFGPAQFGTPNPDENKRQNVAYKFFDALREGEAAWFVLFFAIFGKAHELLWFGGIYMQILWISALILNFKHLTQKPKNR